MATERTIGLTRLKFERNREMSIALAIAREAGGVMLSKFQIGVETREKSDKSPVTEADETINRMILSTLRKEFPNYDIMSEEGSDLSKRSKSKWVCDPLDGTGAFAHGIPTSVFSLALVEDGKPILGVVHDPFCDRTFCAEIGKGAYLYEKSDWNKIRVSDNRELEGVTIGCVTFAGAEYDIISISKKLNDEKASILNLGSIVYMGAMVACGQFGGVIHPSQYAHDTAALKIIVEEAGGKVTDLYGNEQKYDGVTKGSIISNKALHEKLLRLAETVIMV